MNSQQLLKVIKDAQNLYYNDPESVVLSDAEYDSLMREAQRQGLSKQVAVGAETTTKIKAVHASRMYSLDNIYSLNELKKWCERIVLHDNTFLTVEPKLDGCSVSLTYVDGVLVSAATRGNGYEGEDILDTISPIIPAKIKGKGKFQIRGELIVDLDAFQDLNTVRMVDGLPQYAHPRGAAAGILALKQGKKPHPIHYARFYAFDLRGIELVTSQSMALDVLRTLGFSVTSIMDGATVTSVLDRFAFISDPAPGLPTDGVVIKVNDYTLQTVLGHTAKAPKWAIAYKYPSAEAVTKLLTVDFQTGRSGKVTPVAIFEPVLINGSTVERATLNNEDYIETLDLCYGDYITVRKAAEIIPEIVKVHKDLRPLEPLKPVVFTGYCSSCGHLLQSEESQANWYCVSTNCTAITVAKIDYFFSRKCLNVKSLGTNTIKACVIDLNCQSPWDIYNLSKSEWLGLPNFGENKYNTVKQELEGAKKQPWFRLLTGFGIPGVGSTVARTIASRYSAYELYFVEEQGLLDLDGVGKEIAESVIYWFSIPSHRSFLDWCVEQGFNTAPEAKAEPKSKALQGFTFVISGTFLDDYEDKIDRSKIQDLITINGGVISSNVSANTNYLVAGISAGSSKLAKVKEFGVHVIDLNTLYYIIQDNE
jgi:DNA ligase (NAD+)